MYIRKTTIKSKKNGGVYHSYRLVESTRVDGKVRQKTLLNLGKHFDIDPAHWGWLVQRIDHIVHGNHGQANLFDNPGAVEVELEAAAQRYAALVLQKLSAPVADNNNASLEKARDYQPVDVSRIDVLRPRSVGGETLALGAIQQLNLDEKLASLGFNSVDQSAAVGVIIARMLHPASERETHRWLQQNSGLGELIGVDFETISLDRLYKIGDKLLKAQSELECHLARREQDIFSLSRRIVLYDLTNTYFEGQALNNELAARGRSKEKRTDCPLVTMGLVLDGDGFPLASQIFQGNASEPATLEEMIHSLTRTSANQGSIVVVDAGIATQANLDWLKKNNFHYIAVSRERHKERPSLDDGAVVVKDKLNDQVIAKRIMDGDTQEIRLYCHSEKREAKDDAIRNKFDTRFELALANLHEGLKKKGTTKKYEKVLERVGRIKEKYSRAAQHYDVVVKADNEGKQAVAVTWSKKASAETKSQSAGVYCLRTDVKDLSEKELWKTYTMLTDVEASFKSMKSELGLRPIYHQKESRVTAHLFITLLAYHIVHTLRVQLKSKNINISWESIRNIMSSQQRVTVSIPMVDQHLHVRKTSRPEATHQQIYHALGIDSDPVGTSKTIVEGDQ